VQQQTTAVTQASLYKQCFNETLTCYVSDYERHNFTSAQQHCIELGNMPLPTHLSREMDRSFRSYLRSDRTGVLTSEYVWLGAKSQPLTTGQEWTWTNGLSTGKSLTLSLIHPVSNWTHWATQVSH